ncbi:eukaryotic translation initiation factor 3 subunit E-like [Gossypium hirsutum]|uniref:Eukaryotic translation initiation factor 3 subunit E-like n=1 Tax=Gossypium hirsutum TaxID=3635 RepID=A0ABM3B8R7_GOSHI|nr:eukaryotic translation initiation factor 3 subunit E-like [Gossypium hirsutum]
MQNWDIALEELNRLKEIIDSKSFSSPLNQVQSRIWLMHWSLFIFFNHDNGRTQIIDLFNQDKEEVDELCRTLKEKEDSSCTASDQFSCITI